MIHKNLKVAVSVVLLSGLAFANVFAQTSENQSSNSENVLSTPLASSTNSSVNKLITPKNSDKEASTCANPQRINNQNCQQNCDCQSGWCESSVWGPGATCQAKL